MKIIVRNGGGGFEEETIATFNDNNSHIIVNNHCYVIVNRGRDGKYDISSWIFPEALEVLKNLPPPQ